MKLRRWLLTVMLGPAMMFGLFGVAEADAGNDEPTPEPERPENVTETEWEDLSREEREGLLMDGTGEEGEAIDDDGPEELTEEELQAIAGNEPKPDAVIDEKPTEETPAAEPPTVDEADLLAYRPTITAAEIAAKVPAVADVPAEIQAKLDELEDKFENGWDEDGETKTLSLRDYNRQRDALNRQANAAIFDAQTAAREDARAELEWEKEQAAFFAARKVYAEGTIRSKALFGALNETVQQLNAQPENRSKTGMQILLAADKIVAKEFGLQPATNEPEKKPEAKPTKPPAKAPTIKTLAGVPSSGAERVGTDPFSALDRLSGEALERALERLTPEQRDRYLSL